MRKEQGLRVFENRVLRKILEARRIEVTGEWRRLCNEQLCDVCFAPSIILVIKTTTRRRACGIYSGEERCLHSFGVET